MSCSAITQKLVPINVIVKIVSLQQYCFPVPPGQ